MKTHRWLLMLAGFALLCAALETGFDGLQTWFIQLSGALDVVVPLLLLSFGLAAGRRARLNAAPVPTNERR